MSSPSIRLVRRERSNGLIGGHAQGHCKDMPEKKIPMPFGDHLDQQMAR